MKNIKLNNGNIIISGSNNLEHIKDNANIFDFELTEEEMESISKINKNERFYIPDLSLVVSYAAMELKLELDI